VAVEGVTGIVLAGGRSTRFGDDKLAALLRGRPLLHHAVGALGACCEEVLVVVAPDRDPRDPLLDPDALAALAGGGIRLVRDPVADGGPLVGVRAGLAAAGTDAALIAAGDMPDLLPAVLDDLLERLSIGHGSAVALDDGSGVRPLPAAVRTAPALAAADALLGRGERSLRALLRALHVVAVDREAWAALDPEARTLGDVDEAEDLPPAGR
jgi:molybdopterin-guanine dinucleotide biosynthesis protein A